MKVFEKIMLEAMVNGELSDNYLDREATKKSLSKISLYPCNIEEQQGYLTLKTMDEICNICSYDCEQCLDKYLDHEIEQKDDGD
jgi:hypothetical protein